MALFLIYNVKINNTQLLTHVRIKWFRCIKCLIHALSIPWLHPTPRINKPRGRWNSVGLNWGWFSLGRHLADLLPWLTLEILEFVPSLPTILLETFRRLEPSPFFWEAQSSIHLRITVMVPLWDSVRQVLFNPFYGQKSLILQAVVPLQSNAKAFSPVCLFHLLN